MAIQLGPGTLKIGAVATQIDVSCLVNGARITSEKNEGDSTTKLCGTQVPGSVTYTASLEGNLDVDSDVEDGLFALSWAEPGSQQDFEFVPNTGKVTMAAGTLVLDPLDFGADAYGDTLTSDISFTLVGDVTFTYPTGATRTLHTGVPIRRDPIRLPEDSAAAALPLAAAADPDAAA